MRTRIATPTQVQAASFSPIVKDGVINDSIVELRGTLKVAPGNNQRQFFFHGGSVTLKNDGSTYFGEVRPFPWLKNKEGWILNPDGSHKTGSVWVKHVNKNVITLSDQDKVMLAVLQSKPEMVEQFKALGGISPNVLKALEGGSLTHKDIDFNKYITSIFGHTSVKLTFTIPQQFFNAVTGITEMVKDKADNEAYSFVIRFDAKRLNAAKELANEYNSEDLRQDIPIYPTYVGFMQGSTYEDDESKYVDPEIAAEAWAEAMAPKQVSYVSRETLASRAGLIQTRVNGTGTGKKDHKKVVDELFAAAESHSWEAFETALAVLRGIEERGSNKAVPIGYSQKISETAYEKANQVSSPLVVPATQVEDNTEPQSIPASDNALDAFFS